ncbi:MAG: hypothetical protein EPGJADBJ_01220 [Saprospiraceae bacterium]|nr:hypothetical protein [Saprospiraceae bacterium]
MKNLFFLPAVAFSKAGILLCLSFLAACTPTPKNAGEKDEHSPSEAGAAFMYWGMARTFPDGRFYTEKYADAMAQMRLAAHLRGERSPTWEAIGPKNIGGRTLCLAVNPLDTNILWAGSASGGLWKSTTAGRGAAAWERVETGFPILGVSAVALSPSNPDIVYIGTGEVYNLENSAPNVAIRTTRGTYGIGILKSTDGGATWTKSLDWSYGDLRGVQDIKINPLRPATLYAATTEGLLRSYDAGASWQTVHNIPMAVDIEINPLDTNKIYVTCGSLNDDAASGIFRSLNGGASFSKLANGLPSSYSGKTLLGVCAGNPDVMYASVGNDFAQEGLYRTDNGGNTWTKVSTQNVCSYQGWYSHDVTVHPANPDIFLWGGIDAWKSTNGGISAQKKSSWFAWYFGQVPVGGPEGPDNYVHADIHRVYWQENDPNKVYLVTDGGIFVSYDGGETFEGRNGGYQTQQFYANLGNSATNPNICIGGMQDNATAIYTGNPAWTRAIGGDGECAAIHPLDDQIMFGSSQYLNVLKTTDGGEDWYSIGSPEMVSEDACFNGPFEIAPSDPDIMYAGAQSLHRSDDAGETWTNATDGFITDADPILTIAIHPTDPDLVFCSTAPVYTNTARVFKVNAGVITELTGLPNRLCMDIAIHPTAPDTVYAVFAGFNTQHVWLSANGGITWTAIDNGLPDVPVNTLLIDPLQPHHVYIGNDLGVWLSKDGGASWEVYSADAPQAMLAMHLSISADRKLRVATHGLGVWQTDMAFVPVSTGEPAVAVSLQAIFPNPVSDVATVKFYLPETGKVALKVLDVSGKVVWQAAPERLPAGDHSRPVDLGDLPAGTYGVLVEIGNGRTGRLVVKS